ncbi:hypothetical protein [Saccharopolyspora rhizosphaerae]|uniref:hypothetical protein n=1 Tax=Saccharopolyspora rhizosphaerae TaxID=2492662 RepID=UPI00131558CC|nr:hypothetical protein [Saccharopolyspora rhizosphaerae]
MSTAVGCPSALDEDSGAACDVLESRIPGYVLESRIPGYVLESRIPGYVLESRIPGDVL